MDMYGYSGVVLVKRFLDNGVFEVTNMSDINKANPQGCDNGALTDRFGVLIQGLLAIVAFSTLMCEYQQPDGSLALPPHICLIDLFAHAEDSRNIVGLLPLILHVAFC